MTAPKIPMNLFAIPFGLAGLGEAWSALAGQQHAPALVGNVILLIAAGCWLVLVAAHLRHLFTVAPSAAGEVSGDLLDPVLAPFTSLIVITPILLASDGLFPQAAASGRVVTNVFIALTVLLAGWFVGQWFVEPLDLDRYHPGYFLPTVAGSLVASQGAAGTDPQLQGLLNALTAVLNGSGHRPLASIVSNSWLTGSEVQPGSTTKIEHADLLRAAAEGVGMYFAAGDDSGLVAPADDPFATAVGGTTLGLGQTGNRLFETGWSTGWLLEQKGKWLSEGEYGASGGGPSALFKQPAYQRGVVPAALSKSAGKTGPYRSVPDISADADPAAAMAVGTLTIAAGRKPVFRLSSGGGTSQATPLVAGMVAAAQQGMKAPFGFINPVLYKLAGGRAFHDVLPLTASTPVLYRGITCGVARCGDQQLDLFDVQSTNKAANYDGQVTLKGYDNMTGLGTPDGQAFISALRATQK